MARNVLSTQILSKATSYCSASSTAIFSRVPTIGQNVITRRGEHIDAKFIVERSPYEELEVDIDDKSSASSPMKVNAYGNERSIACVCDDMRFMTLVKGPPVKCKCGYWFQLVDARKFWTEPPIQTREEWLKPSSTRK